MDTTKAIADKPFVAIKNGPKTIQVTWGYTTFTKEENDGRISCYIPAFEIYYSVSTEDQVVPKSEIMTRMFFDHFFKHTKSLKSFALEMHKRGFRAPKDAYVIQQLMNNNFINVKFKSDFDELPMGYSDSESITQKSEMELMV